MLNVVAKKMFCIRTHRTIISVVYIRHKFSKINLASVHLNL